MKKSVRIIVSLFLAIALTIGFIPIGKVTKAETIETSLINQKDMLPFARWSSGDPINKINDGVVSYESQNGNRWTDWKPTNQLEENWVGFVFGSSVDIREANISELIIDFYNDSGVYLPKEYKIQYFTGDLNEQNLPEKYGFAENSVLDDDNNWEDVEAENYPKPVSRKTINVKFKPVKTKAVRILMKADEKSLGLTELKVKGSLVDESPIDYGLSDEEVKSEINKLDKLGDSAKDFIDKIGAQTNSSLLVAAKNANEYMRELENLELPEKPELPELKAPLYGGWFRTWHDQYSSPYEDRPNYFGDIPKEVDLAFVFHDWTKPYSEFWKKLALEYVPKMNARGQRVIRTIGVKLLYNEMKDENGNLFENTPEGNKAKAKYIVDTLVNRYGLDGIDVDIEYHDTVYNWEYNETKENQAIEIMKEISRLLKEDGKIFMIDTNMSGRERILREVYDISDYVLLQAYGQYPNSQLDRRWEGFKPYIEPEKFILGFSFYEERDMNRWNDISDKVEGSAAERYAKWQPDNGENGKKAGIIGYAIDRDGVKFLDDNIYTTKYELSKQLKRIMEFDDIEDEIKEINELNLLTQKEKDKYIDMLKNGLNSEEGLLPFDIVKLARDLNERKEEEVKRDLIDAQKEEDRIIKAQEEEAEKKWEEVAKIANELAEKDKKKTPKFEYGEEVVYVKNSGKTIEFKSDAPLKLLDKVLVDGKEVLNENLIIREGSTIVELTNNYLESLDLGKHKFTLVFNGNDEYNSATLETSFSIASSSEKLEMGSDRTDENGIKTDKKAQQSGKTSQNPETSDYGIVSYVLVSSISLIVFAIVIRRKKEWQ